jgi:hypothetical protein
VVGSYPAGRPAGVTHPTADRMAVATNIAAYRRNMTVLVVIARVARRRQSSRPCRPLPHASEADTMLVMIRHRRVAQRESRKAPHGRWQRGQVMANVTLKGNPIQPLEHMPRATTATIQRMIAWEPTADFRYSGQPPPRGCRGLGAPFREGGGRPRQRGRAEAIGLAARHRR